MSEWAPRRFYKDATVETAEGGFIVHLDGRPLRTPGKAPLVVPSRGIAEAMAEEWRAQDEKIDPRTMPFTRTANSAIDKVAPQHPEVADMLAEYGDSDLLCYRAESPAELVARQAERWDPLLDWAAREMGARLEPRAGGVAVIGEGEFGPRLRTRLGNAPRDRAFVSHAHHEPALSCQHTHRHITLPMGAPRRAAPYP